MKTNSFLMGKDPTQRRRDAEGSRHSPFAIWCKQSLPLLFAILFVLSACDTPTVSSPVSVLPSPTATATLTATLTSTPMPTATHTSTPTVTPTMIQSCPTLETIGQIVFSAAPCAELGFECELSESSVTNIYAINSDGTEMHQLVKGGSLIHEMSLSPDNSRIVFMDSREDTEHSVMKSHLYIWDIATGTVLPLMADLPEESSPQLAQWFPDGNHLVYISSVVDNMGNMLHDSQADLYTIRANGADRTKVIERPSNSYIQSVTISPDGSQIAFIGVEWDSKLPMRFTAYYVDSNGSNSRKLLNLPSEAYQTMTFWSPDSSELFISAYLVENPLSFMVRADGLEVSAEVAGKYFNGWRRVSKSAIEVSVCEQDTNTSVWTMQNNSGDFQKLKDISGYCFQASDRWSLDGTQIAFSKYVRLPELSGLYIHDVGNECERQILKGYYVLDLFWLPLNVTIP